MTSEHWPTANWPEGVPHHITGYEKPVYTLLDDAAGDYPEKVYTIFNDATRTYAQVKATAFHIFPL